MHLKYLGDDGCVEEDAQVCVGRPPAETFLIELLSNGPISPKDCIEQGKTEGFSSSTVYRAKRNLGIPDTTKGGLWELPAELMPSQIESGSTSVEKDEFS